MITKKYYTDRECDSLESFFDYIVISYINGQNKQVETYLKQMSFEQIGQFIHHVIDDCKLSTDSNDLIKKVADHISSRQR